VVAAAAGAGDAAEADMTLGQLGLGIGWRPELALDIERRPGLGFVEIVAENIDPNAIPPPLLELARRGARIVPHGISLSLGGAEPVDRRRVDRLAELASKLNAPLVSEHIAYVRAAGLEAGHLLPVPRTQTALDVLVENVRIAQELLPVPLALENIATLFDWPDAEMSESEFIGEILDRGGCSLLLDVANVWANARNRGVDPAEELTQYPLDRLAYVHVAGGEERDGAYHDTHAACVPQGVLDLLEELCAQSDPVGVMLERDDCYPTSADLNHELDAIADAVARGHARHTATHLAR
jgi:uncharacterized protein (UPF0276 family)